MFGNRRLAKRSIIGTKIGALWQDGRYYPGVIQNHPSEGDNLHGETKYMVRFEDGYQREVSYSDIVGPGFNNISSLTLKRGQKVYLTLNGREVQGEVAHHNTQKDEVIVSVPTQNGHRLELCRRIDDLRLMESRKSARLVDQATDYSKLADLNVLGEKRRTVSHVIDVPTKSQRYRPPSIDDEERENQLNDGDDVEMMDETIAAMVLTSLSCSPQSPHLQQSLTDLTNRNSVPLSSSSASSGFHSERSDPSPPLSTNLSESAPATTGGWFFGSYPKDDGLVLEENDDEYEDEENMVPKRKKMDMHSDGGQKKTMFKCTWKGCTKIHNTVSGIEKHVRTAHLGLKESDSDLLDHEEEFYYTEIEVTVDHVTQTFSDMFTSSPPEAGFELGKPIPDHDYQKKDHKQGGNMFASSVPSGGFQPLTTSGSLPVTMPQIKRSLSWQNNASSSPGSMSMSPSIRSSKPSPQERLQQHQAQSPKSHLFSSHKKSRSDVRKCRKVYGMENRDMWCTQCKWKKACSRFTD